jgi:putative ABC transport system permease protein
MLSDARYRLRALFQRKRMDRELDAELEFHIEREIEKLVRGGMSRAEAQRQARLEFGGLEQVRESTRDVRGVAWLDALLQDVRYAWRGIRARPGFASAIVLTLALGIGANAAMFGVVDRMLLRAPAYMRAPDDVHRLYWRYVWNGEEITARNFEYRRYQELVRTASSFESMAAFSTRQLAVGRGADAAEVTASAISATFFDFFAVEPELGRFFTAEEDVVPRGANVAVLGYSYWQTAYGGRTDVLGEEIYAGATSYTIIGVAPRHFTGMSDEGPPALFLPITALAYARAPDYADNYYWSWLEILARRKPGVSEAVATADVSAAFARSWDTQREVDTMMPPAAEARVRGVISPVHFARGPDAGADGRVAAWVMGVAFVVLLIAAANVINLLLVRAVHRRREIALRLALGVSRPRLVQQLMVETLLLATLGAVAGLAAARWGGDALRAVFLNANERVAVLTDMRTIGFTAALTLAIALLTGLAPALQSLRSDVADTLKAGMRDSAYRSSAVRTSLLLFQSALCVVLLIGAGLFVRSLLNVRSLQLGYDAAAIVVVDTNLRSVELSPAERDALADRVLEVAAAAPGVQSATLTASVPFYTYEGRGAPYVPGRDSTRLLGRYTVQIGSPTYFETVGTRIVRGRAFNANDVAGAPHVVVVSEAMAAAIWPDEDPIGKLMRFGSDSLPMLRVIGVAENITARSFAPQSTNDLWYYLPVAQYRQDFGAVRPTLFVRVQGDPEDHIAALRQRLQREMPGDAYVNAVPFDELLAPQRRSWQVGATMFVVFAALALILATIGLYSVIAYAVAQRTRELGLRIALGASVSNVVRMVVNQGVLFAIVGVAAGGAAAWLAARWVQPLLYSASARDPVIFAGVAAILLLVALAATARPALRATRVDPTIALRSD